MFKCCYRRLAPLALLAVLATLLLVDLSAACPTCKEGLAASDPQYQSTARGFYYSILFMMSMPYIILGSFGYLAFVSIRRANDAKGCQAVEGSEL